MQTTTKAPLFPFGQIVATPGALAALEKAGQQPGEFLARHGSGDWGELDEHDRKENQLSLERGFRLLSSYRTNAKERLWLITEADRSVTTLLLALKFVLPNGRPDFPLAFVNLDERTRAYERMHGEVPEAYIAVHELLQVKVL
jgi:hypothetical protein